MSDVRCDLSDLAWRLQQPHEWGYRDPVEGGFVSDDTPFHAASVIQSDRNALRQVLKTIRDLRRLALTRLVLGFGAGFLAAEILQAALVSDHS